MRLETVQIPANARTYVHLDPARPGRMAAWREDDFTTNVVYRFTDRAGCATAIESTIVVDVVGAPIWERHAGRICAPPGELNESYTRSGSMGIWKRPDSQGEADVIGKKFYTSAADVPEERALLVRALLAGGGELRLMPEGEARLTLLRALSVTAGGRTLTVTGYRVSISNAAARIADTVVWIDPRGDLFAIDGLLVREGWEAAMEVLRRTGRGTL